jgi:hypothetical protein
MSGWIDGVRKRRTRPIPAGGGSVPRRVWVRRRWKHPPDVRARLRFFREPPAVGGPPIRTAPSP